MNHQLLAILAERPDFRLAGEDRKIIEFFVEYMDHSSLYLLRYDDAEDPIFIFTNDAQRFTFPFSEIKKLHRGMKSGVPVNWDEMPFEYVSKNA